MIAADNKADKPPIRAFSRVFVTVPAAAGGILVTNDMLTITNATPEQTQVYTTDFQLVDMCSLVERDVMTVISNVWFRYIVHAVFTIIYIWAMHMQQTWAHEKCCLWFYTNIFITLYVLYIKKHFILQAAFKNTGPTPSSSPVSSNPPPINTLVPPPSTSGASLLPASVTTPESQQQMILTFSQNSGMNVSFSQR